MSVNVNSQPLASIEESEIWLKENKFQLSGFQTKSLQKKLII